MMFDLFAEHRHFGVVEFSAGLAIHQLRNQHLATVMFDMRFVEDVVLNLAPKCWIENLLLNHRVNDEFGADLLAKLFLAIIALRLFELFEQDRKSTRLNSSH